MTTTSTNLTVSTDTYRAVADSATVRLRVWIGRSDRWMAAIDAYKAAPMANKPQVRRMPSKASKHAAYSDAGSVRRMLILLDLPVPPVPQDVDGLRAVVAAAQAAGIGR